MPDSVAVILQARMNSTRLPGKVLSDLAGRPMLQFIVERLRLCSLVDEILLATTHSSADDVLADLGASLDLVTIRGSEKDVLSRFVDAAAFTDAQIFVRITCDCPFVDPYLLDQMIVEFKNLSSIDYLSNTSPPSFPDGLDVEIFTRRVLFLAHAETLDPSHREHVTSWIRESGDCSVITKTNSPDLSSLRWTVDVPEDLQVVRSVLDQLDGSMKFCWQDIYNIYLKSPHLFTANSRFSRNEGSLQSSGQKLWHRAKRVIPGGNMLLSKRPEMFLPDYWPAYFSRSKGCCVWDLDDSQFIDMSFMGVGTNILGYCHPEVDASVVEAVSSGNMTTLNCPEEVYLAEKLVALHPWSDMARFARTGGEANAIAIRIARAATGRDTVAICGYHGWHDWYLATNLQNDSGLAEHLLPGLEPNGVPQGLLGSVKPFSYNRLDQLEKLATDYQLAAVKMEVQRSISPQDGFLEGVRNLCDRLGIVLIFDECTSGFRETLGGLHLKYGIDPDIAIFGKALGNGYAITATIGRRHIMEAAQKTFISSTFWTERIGPVAALKTIDVMERERSWEVITSTGLQLRDSWQQLADSYGLHISHTGLPSLSGFTFQSVNALKYKTYISQEMLKKGYLASTSCYVSISHTPEVVSNYLNALDHTFSVISTCERGDIDIDEILDGPVCHGGFKRLN